MKKKQREVTQKHHKNEAEISTVKGDIVHDADENRKSIGKKHSFGSNKSSKHSFSDDSDLASLAREFEEEDLVKESPFIRKVCLMITCDFRNISYKYINTVETVSYIYINISY